MYSIAVPSRECSCFFNDTAPTEIYTLSLHDALPISPFTRQLFEQAGISSGMRILDVGCGAGDVAFWLPSWSRSEEHTSELQSHSDLVCRLLLEKKKKLHGSWWIHQS